MVVTVNGVRSLKRYRLVIAQKSKLQLTQEVIAALASHSRDHRLTASSFFPCSIDREYLYGYAGDGYCIFIKPPKIGELLIPGIHYFDAHRLQPLLLQASALQVHVRESPLVGPEGAGETVDIPRRKKNKPPLQVKLRQREKKMTRIHLQRNHGSWPL